MIAHNLTEFLQNFFFFLTQTLRFDPFWYNELQIKQLEVNWKSFEKDLSHIPICARCWIQCILKKLSTYSCKQYVLNSNFLLFLAYNIIKFLRIFFFFLIQKLMLDPSHTKYCKPTYLKIAGKLLKNNLNHNCTGARNQNACILIKLSNLILKAIEYVLKSIFPLLIAHNLTEFLQNFVFFLT